MQLIATAPVDQKKLIGRYANELKQEIEARWTAYERRRRGRARPPAASTSRCPDAGRGSAIATR